MNDKLLSVVIGNIGKLGVSTSKVNCDSTFESLSIDSLDHVELIMSVEAETGIVLTDEEANSATSVGGLVNLLDKYKTRNFFS